MMHDFVLSPNNGTGAQLYFVCAEYHGADMISALRQLGKGVLTAWVERYYGGAHEIM